MKKLGSIAVFTALLTIWSIPSANAAGRTMSAIECACRNKLQVERSKEVSGAEEEQLNRCITEIKARWLAIRRVQNRTGSAKGELKYMRAQAQNLMEAHRLRRRGQRKVYRKGDINAEMHKGVTRRLRSRNRPSVRKIATSRMTRAGKEALMRQKRQMRAIRRCSTNLGSNSGRCLRREIK